MIVAKRVGEGSHAPFQTFVYSRRLGVLAAFVQERPSASSRVFFTESAGVFAAPNGQRVRKKVGQGIFARRQEYLGQWVEVCGYIHDRSEDINIWPSRMTDRQFGPGLAFMPTRAPGAKSLHDGKSTCVTGQIVDTRCGADLICNWTAFRYALKEEVR